MGEKELNEHQAFCSSCNVDFGIAHSGKYDVKQHAPGVNHKKCAFYWKSVLVCMSKGKSFL